MKTSTNDRISQGTDSGPPERANTFEDVLNDLKLSELYHLRFLFLISFLIIINAGYPLQYVFTAENIGFWCENSKCNYTELITLEHNTTLDYKCYKYELIHRNETCTENNIDVSSMIACSEWVYEKPNSFVAQFNLGCEDWKRTLVGTMHNVGFMIGLLFMGPLSDKFGRKKILIFNSIVAGVVGISKSFMSSYWIYIALEILEPMLGDNFSTIYTIALEMMTTKDRPTISFILAVCVPIGEILTAFIAYCCTNWRIFLVLIYGQAVFIIFCIFWLNESPRWLLIKGRKAEAVYVIRKAAKMNNVSIDESKIVNLKCEEKSNITLQESLKVTFLSRKLLIRLIVCICIWFTGLFNSYALSINSVSLKGNKYLNFALVSLANTVAGVIFYFMLKNFKRKGPLVTVLAMTGVFCVSQSFVPKDFRWCSTILFAFGKINASITMQYAYLYTTELFPTYTRNTMLALCSSMGRTGTILAPLTPLLLTYWSGLPSLLIGILSLVTASVVTLIPNTSEDIIPDNVRQAEDMGNK